MKLWQNYFLANSVEEALDILVASPVPSCIIAGGTDLMLDLQQGNHPPVNTLVDITSIPELTCIEIREDKLFIGAAVPLSKIAASPLAIEHAEVLVEACHLIGGPQVRNVATLGGNVAHALPAADGTIAMMCLDVHAEIASLQGRRRQPLAELFLGPGKSALRKDQEILIGFFLPIQRMGEASAFRRIMRTQGIALPILNLSVWIQVNAGLIEQTRVASGPAGPVPKRLTSTERALIGKRPGRTEVENALQELLQETSYRSSPLRASAEYRRHLVGILFEETLESAWQRATKN